MAFAIDSGLTVGGNPLITVQTEFERTSPAVANAYSAYVSLMKSVLEQPPADVNQNSANLLSAAINGLRALAINGMQVPREGDPSGTLVTRYVTMDMAQQIDLLSRSLRAVGVANSTPTIEDVKQWQDLATQGLNDIMTKALRAYDNNNSFQAMIELEYVQAGNDILETQLTNLNTALTATRDVTDLLGQLQELHNMIAPGNVNTNAVLAFKDPVAAVAGNQEVLFNLLTPAQRLQLGITQPTDITPATYKAAASPTFYGIGVYGNLQWLLDPVFGNAQVTMSQLTSLGITTNANGDLVGPATTTIAQKQAILNLLTLDQLWAIMENNGVAPPATVTQANLATTLANSLDDSQFNFANQTQFHASTIASSPNNFGVSGAIMARVLFPPAGSPISLTMAQVNGAGITFPPTFNFYSNLASDIALATKHMTADDRGFWGIDVNAQTIHPFFYEADIQALADAHTGPLTGVWRDWFNGIPAFVAQVNINRIGGIGGYSVDQYNRDLKTANGIVNAITVDTVIPLLSVADAPSNATQFNAAAQTAFGQPIDPVVDFKGRTDNDVLNSLIEIRKKLAAQLTILDQLNPPPASGRDPNSIGAKIADVLQDLETHIPSNLDVNTQGPQMLAGLSRWILDNLDKHSSSGIIADQNAAKTAGDIQRNLQEAITSATNLNDTQKEDLRRFMFIFDEFYKSASAMLTRITQILEKMAQNAGR